MDKTFPENREERMINYISNLLFPESREDREFRLKAKRLREINSKPVPTMEELNEKRMLIGYPHMLEIVKHKCPKCDGKMWHDNFQKCWDYRKHNPPHFKACYNCTECKYRVLFDLYTNKFDKKPFGKNPERSHKTGKSEVER